MTHAGSQGTKGHKATQRKSTKMSRRHSVIPLAHMHVLVVPVCVTHQIFDILANCIWNFFFFFSSPYGDINLALKFLFKLPIKVSKHMRNTHTYKVSEVNEAKQSSDFRVPSCQMFTKWWSSIAKLFLHTTENINFYYMHTLRIWQWVCS